jgi:hypothetical protein
MAIQSIGGYGLPFPAWPTLLATTPAFVNFTIDANGEKAAIIFAASAAKAIHKVHFRTGTVTTGGTLDIRVETVDNAANGDPTGTLWAATTNGSSVVAGTDDNVWKSVTLTADATVSIGNIVALVAVCGSPGSLSLLGFGDQSTGFPYGDLYTGTWTKNLVLPIMVPEYSDGSFEPIFGLSDTGDPVTTTSTFNSGSTTNRRGNRFTLPFPARAKGCWVWADTDGDYTVILYDTDGTTPLATTASVNNFQRQANAASIHLYPFTTTASLAAGSMYRLAIVPSSVTNVTVYDVAVVSAAMLDMFPGGQNCHLDIYTSGAWVNTTTARTYLGVFLDGFDDGAQTGGGGGFIIGG